MIRLWTLVGFGTAMALWCCTDRRAEAATVQEPIAPRVVSAAPDASVGVAQLGAHSEKILQLLMDAKVQK